LCNGTWAVSPHISIWEKGRAGRGFRAELAVVVVMPIFDAMCSSINGHSKQLRKKQLEKQAEKQLEENGSKNGLENSSKLARN